MESRKSPSLVGVKTVVVGSEEVRFVSWTEATIGIPGPGGPCGP